MRRLWLYLFGCSHENVTWPIAGFKNGQAWQSCLDCGRRRPVTFDSRAVLRGNWVRDKVSHAPSKTIVVTASNSSHDTILERG